MKGVDPVDDRLVVDRKQAPDAAKAVAFEVEFECRLFCFVIIAEWSRHWRVLAATLLALKTLTTRACKTGSDLARSVLAVGTSNHVERYSIICLALDSPVVWKLCSHVRECGRVRREESFA